MATYHKKILILFLIFLFLAPAIHSASTGSSHSLISPRDGIGYPYHSTAHRWKITGLPGGLKYASADVEEFHTPIEIQADDPNAGGFVGRLAGGGRRAGIRGNQHYGSGYPGETTEGVKGRGFPFFFHPITYGQYPGYGPSIIYDHEYGEPGKKTRPGGPLHYMTIQPPKSLVEGLYPEMQPIVLYAVGDKPSLDALKLAIWWTCARSDYSQWLFAEKLRISEPKKFKGPAEDPDGPTPEQTVMYYRGSSLALFLVGYNNTAQVVNDVLQDTPLPSATGSSFFTCINSTFGSSMPLVISMGAVPYQTNAASSVVTPLPVVMILIVSVVLFL